MQYPIEWRGETIYASDLTDELKFKYCQFLFDQMLVNAAKYMTPARYLKFEKKLTAAPPEWTSIADDDVIASLDKPYGVRLIVRVILDRSTDKKSDKYMSDDEVDELIAEKASPTSDLTIAMNRIRENADPKASRGEPSSPRQKDASEHTQPSATSQSV